MTSTVIRTRNVVAAYARSRTPEDPQFLDARREHAAAKLEQYIERVVAEAPPLTAAQRHHLAALISGGGAR